MGWQPILDGERAAAARAAVDHIVQALAEGGDSGRGAADPHRVLLDLYLARADDSDQAAERAFAGLRAVTERAGSARGPGLLACCHTLKSDHGFACVGFVLEHAARVLAPWLESADDDPCGELDDELADYVLHCPAHSHYHLGGGLAGIAIYAAERLPRPSARNLLGMVIDRLAADAERSPRGVTWLTPPDQLPPAQRAEWSSGYYDLGVSHGLAALPVVFACAMRERIRTERAHELYEGLVEWLLAQRRAGEPGAGFPAWVPAHRPDAAPPTGAWESWCYGGLGLSVALVHAARLIGDQRGEQTALELSRQEATRPHSPARDASLCHGAAGNAHLYQRLYCATGDVTFRRAALAWFDRVLAEQRPGTGIGGYEFWAARAMSPDRSFLSGSTGVALSLLGAISEIDPAWDRLLLADVPTG